MKRVFLSWLGESELLSTPTKSGIARAIRARNFDEVHLLGNLDPEKKIKNTAGESLYPYTEKTFKEFSSKLPQQDSKIFLHLYPLTSPTDFLEIYTKAISVIKEILNCHSNDVEFAYHLSSGTAPMISMWVIIAKTQFKGELIETKFPAHVLARSPENKHHIRTVEVPFSITAELLPEYLDSADKNLQEAFYHPPAFDKVLGQSTEIRDIIKKSNYVASRGITVLLEGESGTGKELFAEAIHLASNVSDKPFVPVNCGAIPDNLIESELFGYEKGAFTGANTSKPGLFESANGGTIFLDEIGETDKSMQVKLLRVLQSREIRRIGGSKTIKVKARIIAATNRDLFSEVKEGRFREDLYYRLAVAVIRIPPLRERQGDVPLLIDEFVRMQTKALNLSKRRLSGEARAMLITHSWPGNVRELINTVTSLLVWSENEIISAKEVEIMLCRGRSQIQNAILNRPLSQMPDFLDDILNEVSRHYFDRALKEANGNAVVATKLLGLKNYQTFNNRRKKLSL